jgi:hypothetical protein
VIDLAALREWNEKNKRARLEYCAHPLTSSYAGCRKPYCVCRKARERGCR